MRPDDLTETQWQSLLEGLALAEYSLVLGAGASLDSTNRLGEPLLSGAGLRDRLLAHYKIPGGNTQGLRQVYDLARLVARNGNSTPPKELIAPWFSGCSVSDWYGDLVAIPWRVIWNLNIDDVLTNAYHTRFKARARQELRVMSWRDRWTAQRNPLDRVQAVHLHGSSRSGDLVFGSLEYLAATIEGGAAHKIFSDEWVGGLPTVVVGASLEDELDLATPLLGDMQSDAVRPSIIVKPDFTDFDAFRLRQSGLLPVRLSAEDFFRAVKEDWEDTLRSIATNRIPGNLGMNPLAASFLRSFRKPFSGADRWHDLYAGDEPIWKDIADGLDVRRDLNWTLDPTSAFSRGLRVYAFHGELSGTTTAELRFLHDLSVAGYEVLEYSGDGRFDVPAIHWMAKQGARYVLRVPRLEDFADAAAELKALTDDSGAPVVLVTSLRSSQVSGLKVNLGSALKLIRVNDQLKPPEVERLLETLTRHNRLNVLLELKDRERIDFVQKTHRSSLIDSLASITRGRTFAARYTEAYSEVNDPMQRRILDVILIASEARSELALGLLARAASASVVDLRSQLAVAPLVRLVRHSVDGVSARHWGLAARACTQVLSVERRYQATVDLARAAAPYVHPTTISKRTREVSLVARLMDAQRVVAAFGRERASILYDELETEFEWNSRFWEQRALAEIEAREPRFERAEAWAREAVQRHEDGLSLNTLATVLLRRSVASASLEEDAFFEGLGVVDEARRMSLARITEHPYVTAFSYLRRGRSLASDAAARQRIDNVFNYWRLEVESSLAWGQAALRTDLERLIQRYLAESF